MSKQWCFRHHTKLREIWRWRVYIVFSTQSTIQIWTKVDFIWMQDQDQVQEIWNKNGGKLISFGCKTKSKKFGKHGVAYKKANYKESHWKISLKSLARLSCIGTSWNEHHEAISLIFLSAVFLSGSKIVVPWAKENNESVKIRELCERRKFGKTAVF